MQLKHINFLSKVISFNIYLILQILNTQKQKEIKDTENFIKPTEPQFSFEFIKQF